MEVLRGTSGVVVDGEYSHVDDGVSEPRRAHFVCHVSRPGSGQKPQAAQETFARVVGPGGGEGGLQDPTMCFTKELYTRLKIDTSKNEYSINICTYFLLLRWLSR